MKGTVSPPATARKPPVARVRDEAERAADRVAEHLAAPLPPDRLRCASCAGADAPCPACAAAGRGLRQRAPPPSPAAVPPPAAAAALSGSGRPLPEALRVRFERRLGMPLPPVRLYTGAPAAHAAASIGARAFALGDAIFFGAGEFQPGSARGQRLLAHELGHVLQHEQPPRVRADNGATPTGAEAPTLEALIRAQPPGFHDARLDRAYQQYLRSERAAADPATWALRQTSGRPRERLVRLLGPDYARGHRSRAARPPVDVSAPVAPAGYDPARMQQDLAALETAEAAGGGLSARLGSLQYDPAAGMQISAGHQAILQGNVGEILARPLLEQALQEVRRSEPDARLFLGVRAELRMSDGGWTNPVLFSDGLIGVIEPGGLRVLRVAEIKSGAGGGIQIQEQAHRWSEGHMSFGLRLLLPGVARTFEYSDAVREVRNLVSAPRLAIVPSDARFAGARSGHGIVAPVITMRLPQSSAEIGHLTALSAQHLLLRSLARQALAAIRDHQRRPALVASTLELQQSSTIARLVQHHQGLALVGGVLYRVGESAEGRQLTRLPMLPLQWPAAAAGTGAPRPDAAALPPPAPTASPAAPGTAAVPRAPLTVPGIPGSVALAPGVRIPSNVINVSGQPMVVGGGRVVPPTPTVELRAGDIVVRGASGGVIAIDAASGRPLGGVFEGGRLYSVAPAGRVIGIGADGRAVVSTTAQLVPLTSEPVAGAAGQRPGRPGPALRGAAAGVGLLVVANEILAPVARNLQQQRRNIAIGQAQIDFWAQFGGNPRHAVWEIGEDRKAAGAEADTETFGSGSYPYVREIDTAAFGRTLPTLITSHRDFLLFLDMAKVLGTIVEEPAMPAFPSAEERRRERRYHAVVDAPDRALRRRIDVTDIIAPLGRQLLGVLDEDMRARLAALPAPARRQVFRLGRGSETPLYRSARGGQPILSDQQLLGDDPWVRTLGTTREGGFGAWFFHGQWNDRVLVAPANADAQRAAQVSAYVVKKPPDEVLEEVRAGNRPILDRTPADGEVVSFVAGPEPGESRFGETRYYRHPNWPEVRWTAAIGELHSFWVDARDLEPVAPEDVERYAGIR